MVDMRWFVVFAVACEGASVPPELLSFTLDPTTGPAGTTVTSTVEVADFELTGHDEAAGMDGHAHEDAGVTSGHVHIYLDDLLTNPLLMQAVEVDTFEIPAETEVGEHTLIARLHDSTHLIIEPQVTLEATFEVTSE